MAEIGLRNMRMVEEERGGVPNCNRSNCNCTSTRIFWYLDIVSLCSCAKVSQKWKALALDGSNWSHVDLFEFQTDITVRIRILGH